MMKNIPSTFWTFEDVEAAMVDAAELWWRSPGGGRSPWATDGPWYLSARELYGPDVDKDAPLRRLPLNRLEVARRDRVSEWLALVPIERDRKLVVLVLLSKAKRAGRADWKAVQRGMGVKLGRGGLRWRYEKAIATIARRLTADHVAKSAA